MFTLQDIREAVKFRLECVLTVMRAGFLATGKCRDAAGDALQALRQRVPCRRALMAGGRNSGASAEVLLRPAALPGAEHGARDSTGTRRGNRVRLRAETERDAR